MAKPKTKSATEKKRSVEQLVGIIATKDQALSDQSLEVGGLKKCLSELRKSESGLLEVVVQKKKVIQYLENKLAEALGKADTAGGNKTTVVSLEAAVNVLRDEGFEVFTDAKITNCRDESGKGRRSFRRRGRYEVVIARGRKRL